MEREQIISVLRAGGYLLPGTKTPSDVAVDTIDARVFEHPAIPNRKVVRLTPSNLAQGEDAAMDILGFEASESVPEIALRVRQALGFPEWVLVHDPKNASSALALSRELKKEARRAKSKPGNSKIAFDGMGAKISKKTPHFLPSFYEEVARAFVESGNTTYAATYFGKAREAEQMYALEVDETRRRDAFVEFALAGALTNKVMSEYARDLAKRHGDDLAYDYFYDLCVRRTLGGTPPHAQMVTELRRLAKAAGKKQPDEDKRFVSDIWEAPALTRAATKYWETYEKAYVQLAKDDPRIRGRVLNTFPSPSGKADGFKAFWVKFLSETGADKGLTDPVDKVDAAARPEGSPAAWLTKFVSHRMTSGYSYYRRPTMPDEGFDLVRRMAERLVADGNEVSFSGGGWYQMVDVDILDLMLELEIPVTVPTSIDLNVWATVDEGVTERPRELSYLGDDERFSAVLDGAVGAVFGEAVFEATARGKKGLQKAREQWLNFRVENVSKLAAPGFSSEGHDLRTKTTGQTFKEFPSAWERLHTVDVLGPLERTIHGGFLGEYAWPEAADAYRELSGPKMDVVVQATAVFPYLILWTEHRAIVVGPKGRLLEHDFKLPKGKSPNYLRYAQGQLLVVFYDASWNMVAYWSGNPKKTFPGSYLGWGGQLAVERKDGSVVEGPVAYRAGDETMPSLGTILSDGESFWRREGWGDDQHFLEFDPDTGKPGRKSLPACFEDRLLDGWKFQFANSDLYPLPQELHSSLLGCADGLYWRAVNSRDGEYKTSTPNGDRDGWVNALIRVAGTKDEFADLSDGYYFTRDNVMLDQDGGVAGLGMGLSSHFAHYWKVRDEAGSKKLRSLAKADFAALLAAALDLSEDADKPSALLNTWAQALRDEAGKSLAKLQKLVDAGKKLLAGNSAKSTTDQELSKAVVELVGCNAELADGLARVVARHAGHVRSLAEHIEASDPTHIEKVGTNITDSTVWGFFGNVANGNDYNYYNYTYGEQKDLMHYLRLVHRFFETGEEPKDFPWISTDLTMLLPSPAVMGWLAASPSSRNPGVLLAFIETLVEIGFLDLPGEFRMFNSPKSSWKRHGIDPEWTTFLTSIDGNRYLAKGGYWNDESIRVLEYAPTGEFKLPKGVTASDERAGHKWSSESAMATVELVRERGAYPVSADVVDRLAELCGISKAEAGIFWSTFPNTGSWEKNFMPKELREQLGLKVAEAAVARDGLRQMSAHKKMALFQGAFPQNPSDLWENQDSVIDQFAAAWGKQFGARVSLPEDMLAGVKKDLGIWEPREILTMIADPNKSTYGVVPKYELKKGGQKGRLEVVAANERYNSVDNFYTFLKVARYLALNFKANDPILQRVPEGWEIWKQTLQHEDFMVSVYSPFGWVEYEKIGETLAKMGPNKTAHGVEYYDDGVVMFWPGQWSIDGLMRTKAVLDGKTSKFEPEGSPREAILSALSDETKAFVSWIANNKDADRYAADPAFSAPKTVEAVEKELGVSTNAAIAFLQILALPNPTSSNVKNWMGWSTGAYKKAVDELSQKGVVVEAKRSRAGRAHFLDGPWLDLRSPHLPIEGWKVQMYPPEKSYGYYLPSEPLGDLFARAWARWTSGDKPKF